MELLCPHCLKKVTVSDDKAGQVLNCPLCQGVFVAPALPSAQPPPSAPPPQAPPPPYVPPPGSLEIPLIPSVAPGPPQSAAPSPTSPPPPPRPPADYTRRFSFRLRPDVLVYVAPVCLFLIVFVLSFFDWHAVLDQRGGLNLWQLGFTSQGTGVFLAYVLFTILTFLVAVACALFELRVLPALPQLALLMPWKSGITFVLLGLTFLLFAYDYQQGLFAGSALANPITLAEKIAFRLHLLALIAVGLELWVQSRVARSLPLPRFSMRL
jgi:hypothetical protein